MITTTPHNTQKRVFQRLNRNGCSQSKFTIGYSGAPDKGKFHVLKKILNISSIKQQTKKILLKYLQCSKSLCEESIEKIMSYARNILDNAKQNELSQGLASLLEHQVDAAPIIFKIIKELVISPIEKSYIGKIEKELREDDTLEQEIKSIEEELQDLKMKKLKDYDTQKSGIRLNTPKMAKSAFKEVQNFENKLMRANQKLNELTTNNNKLRQKINQLRKQKNSMEDIYSKLKIQLQTKKQNVQKTIKFAGQAYYSRNKAEEDLKTLKEQSELKKEQFKEECQRLNNEIQYDLRFKQFIKSKEIQKEQLEKLERQVQQNESNIELKKQQNFKIDQEYKKSLQKEQEIKKCFERIKKELGYYDNNNNNDLLTIFLNLYQKNMIMKQFVNEVTTEVEELQNKIVLKKQEIQHIYLKGSADDYQKGKFNQEVKEKHELHEKKKKILDTHYEKSVSTIQTIKKYLEDIFEQIGIDQQITDKLKNSNLNQENLTQFLGQLEKKSLQSISHYGKLVSEQLKAQKGSGWQIQKQINEINNIMTLQTTNNTVSNASLSKPNEYPSQLLIKVKQDKFRQQELQKALTIQDFKKYAIESLQQYNKKQIPKDKHLNKKYNISTSNKGKKK